MVFINFFLDNLCLKKIIAKEAPRKPATKTRNNKKDSEILNLFLLAFNLSIPYITNVKILIIRKYK